MDGEPRHHLGGPRRFAVVDPWRSGHGWTKKTDPLPAAATMSARGPGQQAHDTQYDVDEEAGRVRLALGRGALRDRA